MRVRKRTCGGGIVIISLAIISALAIKSGLIELQSNSPLDNLIHQYLEKKLIHPSPPSYYQFPKKRQIIYIMGGSEKSLRPRLKKAAQLFHAGIAAKIWIYIPPGITAFDQNLGRNLTNEEWAQRQFTLLNIAKKNIVFIDFKEEFWGTLRESRKVLKQASQQGYDHINVVTSAYHTRRVWLTFSDFAKEHNISFTIYAAKDAVCLRYLLQEYSKLLAYQYFILPLYASPVTF